MSTPTKSPTGKNRVKPLLANRLSDIENIQLSRARWAPHRKKMGLRKRPTDFTDSLLASYDERETKLVEFVQDNIKRKECIHFVPKYDPSRQKGSPIVCNCGEAPERHLKGTDGVTEFFRKGVAAIEKELLDPKSEVSQAKWDPSKDMMQLPTNAFGKIEFISGGMSGRKPAKFVRLADSTPMEQVVSLLVDHWNLFYPRPANLVITIVGGAKNFKLDGKTREIFNHGLVKAAQTTAGWIITSGFNMGVMKAVGEAVREGQSYNYEHMGAAYSFRCIGIAPWGYVEKRDQLLPKDGNGSWQASYKVNHIVRPGHPVSLNPNHTHFLLVDDGRRGKYGGVHDFRAALERKISLSPTDGGLGIPVVLVLVEGGCDALEDVQKSLSQGTPVVICEGTGRAADILAYAFAHYVRTRKGKRMLSARHQLILEDKLREAFAKTWASHEDETAELEKFLSLVLACCEEEKLITVFDMNRDVDLDLAILSALLKGQGATDIGQLREQLQLALTWNRCDVAAEKIFMDNITWPSGYLDGIMTQAILGGKVDFVRLLLQNGVIMKEYLTIPRLRQLYNAAPQNSHIRQLLQKHCKRAIFTLRDVDQLLRRLVSSHCNDIYQSDSSIHHVIFDEDWFKGPADVFANPFLELFIWAVLMQRQDMALFLWECGSEAIPSAIMASRIYGALAARVTYFDSDLRNLYLKNKQEFELMATGVLEACHKVDSMKAEMLIERRYPTWGDMNCLEMAAVAGNQMFLSSACCQNSLNLMWKRGISSSSFKVIFGLVCPIFILTNVRFQNFDEFTGGQLSCCQKLVTFYRAPVTKYVFHLMMYMVFLVCYSYMCLFGIRQTPTAMECVMLAWIFTFACEQFRSMLFGSNADSVLRRIRDWWSFSYYNRLDLLTTILSFTCALLRVEPSYTPAALVIYSLNCVLFYIRVYRDYSASSYLGPKLVMVNNMFKELILYMMILLIVLLAYGVSTQALMFPGREYFHGIFFDVVYYPYWQIYGELYLEELEGTTSDCQGNLTAAQAAACPKYTILVPLLTAVYLLIGNILLLNLLIAIFNNVFQEVEVNSIQIWKYGMYFLVVDYDNKPCLPPPLIIFEHMYLTIKWIIRHTCCRKKVPTKQYTAHQIQLLQLFEEEMLRVYMRKRKQDDSCSTESNIIKIMHRVDEMSKKIEEEKILEKQNMETLKGSFKFGTTLHTGDGLLGTGTSTPKPFSRWPTLERLRTLKDSLRDIAENNSYHGKVGEIETDRNPQTEGTEDSDIQEDAEEYSSLAEYYDYHVNLPGPGTDPNLNRSTASKNFALCKEIVSRNYQEKTKHKARTRKRYESRENVHEIKKKKKKKKEKHRKHMDDGELAKWSTKRSLCMSDSSDDDDNNDGKKKQDIHERKKMNISHSSSRNLDMMEERLARLEQITERKLYNIEVLLRSAVFSGYTEQNDLHGNTPA